MVAAIAVNRARLALAWTRSDSRGAPNTQTPSTPSTQDTKSGPVTPLCYLVTELARKPSSVPPPRGGRTFHVFCSEYNAGASELIREVASLPQHEP